MAKTIATILGIGFLLVGLLGFVAPGIMGLHLSTTHNLIHIISGLAALYFGLAASLSAARLFCMLFGIVYLGLGVIGFIAGSPGVSTLHGMNDMAAMSDSRLLRVIPGAFEVGTSDHIVHLLLGGLFLVGALLTKTVMTRDTDRRTEVR